MNVWLRFFDVLIIVVGLAVQFFFSSRNHVAWDAVILVIFTGFMIRQLVRGRIGTWLEFILLLLVGLGFLMAEWGNGRKALRQKWNAELQKMQTHVMK